jgi:hypothetical protein
MRLIAFVLVASLILTALAEAQPGGAVPRIGYLSPGRGFPFEALREGLQGHGYVEGSIITIERRSAEGHVERLQDLAAELVRLRVDDGQLCLFCWAGSKRQRLLVNRYRFFVAPQRAQDALWLDLPPHR